MTLGEKLKKARLDRGLTQTQVCGTHITRNMLSQLENDSASPSVRTLEHLADALGVSMGWLLEQDPAAEQLQQARQLYRQGDFSSCFEALCDHAAGQTEEGILLLIRSALVLSESALADCRFREAHEKAVVARDQCENSLYAGETELCRAHRVLLRCALEQGGDPEEYASMILSDFSEEGRLLTARYALYQNQIDTAQKTLLTEPTPESLAECLILRGRIAIGLQDFAGAETILHQAETASRLNRIQRLELYRLLEQCCREREDYRQAYFYATRQLQLEKTEA